MQDLANCMWGFVLASHGGTEPMECLELATSTCFLFLFGSLCFSLLLLNSNGNIQLPIVFILIILCSWCSVTLATIVISSSIFPNRLSLLASSYCLLRWSWIWVKNMQNNCNDRSNKHLYRTKIPQQQISGEVDCWQANWPEKAPSDQFLPHMVHRNISGWLADEEIGMDGAP